MNETPVKPVAPVKPLLIQRARQIVIWPDPQLSRKAQTVPDDAIAALRVKDLPSALRDLMDSLEATMLLTGGAGLSAPQLGESYRVICLKVRHPAVTKEGETPVAASEEVVHLINPTITILAGDKVQSREGCLSLPGVLAEVERANYCRVTAFGYDGHPLEMGGDGGLAVALQHELEHLDGVTIADHLSCLKRDVARRRLTKQKARGLRYKFPETIQ